jgi:hypothetical protein
MLKEIDDARPDWICLNVTDNVWRTNSESIIDPSFVFIHVLASFEGAPGGVGCLADC